MSFMMPNRTRERSHAPRSPTQINLYTKEQVKEKIPYIRKKVLKLTRLVNKYKDDPFKLKRFNAHIDQLRCERRHILTHLPPCLQELYNANDINILGFEESLVTTRQTILLPHKRIVWAPIKLKCSSITLKGLPCSRNATSPCGNFCKMHNPALTSVRKIKPHK